MPRFGGAIITPGAQLYGPVSTGPSWGGGWDRGRDWDWDDRPRRRFRNFDTSSEWDDTSDF